ncbi:MAG: CheR family methyltransferase [Thermoleophilia bacterium]
MVQLKKYELDEENFDRFRRLIDQASGIFFDRGKWDLLRLGLADRAESLGDDSLAKYYKRITEAPDRQQEIRNLLAHLSVQETQFFRNLPQFDALQKYVIPEIARRKADTKNRSLRFWSAGCSTGEEPYSIAMSALNVLPDARDWNIQVLGTDLNDDALETAERAWYPEKRLRGLERKERDRYFRPQEGGFVVDENVKRLVNFSSHNMVTESLPINIFGTCDVIFCRNVIIYFTHETAKYVIELFYDILNPGGYLFLGHSETLWKMSAKYSLVEMGDAFIYRKPLPRSMEGRRFIEDRRMRKAPLPPGIVHDRRDSEERRNLRQAEDLIRQAQLKEPAKKGTEDGQISEMASEARAFLDLGEYDKAVQVLESALIIDKTRADINYLLGLANERRCDLDTATECFRKTVYCDDSHSLAYFNLANVLERAGKLKAAVREYRNAAHSFRIDTEGRWEKELDDYDIDSLISLCEWKIENLGALEE